MAVLRVTDKILREVEISLEESFESAMQKLEGSVNEWRALKELSEHGFEFTFKGKLLESMGQLAKFRKVGDVVVKRVIKAEEEPKPEEKGEGEEDKEK